MTEYRSLLKSLSTTFVALVFSFQSILAPALAVGPVDPVGPQGQVGPVDPVGPQSGVGPAFFVAPSPSPSPSPSASPSAAAAPVSAAASPSSAGIGGVGGDSATNSSTGNNSANTATNNQNSSTAINQNNTANHDTNVNVQAVTGNNQANGNTGSAAIESGSVNGQVTVVNIANARTLDGSTAASQVLSGNQNNNIALGGPGVALNARTGNGSQNIAQLNRNNSIQVNVNNSASINNQIGINANTGGNNADGNTGNGSVKSGNVDLAFNLLNLGNLRGPIHLDILSVFGDVNADLVLPTIMANNSTTGANSLNQSSVDANHALSMVTKNDATINNDVNYAVNTGNNSASGNTLGGEIRSGTVTAKAAINNVVNAPTNILYLFNIYGECDCDLSALDPSTYVLNVVADGPSQQAAGNQNTGNGSANDASATDTSNTTITETNTANVNNKLNVIANTGNNATSNNTGKGSIATGNVNIMAQITNLINAKTQAGQQFVLGIVNIFGKWKGKGVTAQAPMVTVPIVSAATQQSSLPNPLLSIPAPAAAPTTTSSLAAFVPAQTIAQLPTTTGRSSSRAIQPTGSTGTGNTHTTDNIDISGGATTGSSSSTGGSASTTTTTIDGTTTTVSSPAPTVSPAPGRGPGRGTFGHFIGVAHAAAQNGIDAAQSMPYLNILLIPLALWLVAELGFGAAIRRRNKKN